MVTRKWRVYSPSSITPVSMHAVRLPLGLGIGVLAQLHTKIHIPIQQHGDVCAVPAHRLHHGLEQHLRESEIGLFDTPALCLLVAPRNAEPLGPLLIFFGDGRALVAGGNPR